MRERRHLQVSASRSVKAVAALVGALALAACAPGQSTDEAADPQETGDVDFAGREMTYLYFTDGPDEQATRDVIADFEAETGATVNLQIVPFGDLQTSLQARLSGGDAPDVVRLADLGPFKADLADLRPYLGEDYADEFIEGMIGTAIGDDGELLAVPSDLTMNGPFVNVDQFEDAGVAIPPADDPWTWDEMLAAADEVQASSGSEFAFAMDTSGHRMSTVLSQFGTRIIEDDQAALDEEASQEAIELITGLMRDGKMDADFWLGSGSRYEGANEIFLAQAAPIYLSGNWQVSQFAENAEFEFAAAPNPCEQECGGFPGGKFLATFQTSPEQALGAAFIEYSNSREVQEQFAAATQFLPTRNDLVEEGVTYPERQEDMDVFLADVQRTPAENYSTVGNPAFGGAATALVEQMSLVVAGEQEAAAAVDGTRSETEQLLEDVAAP